MTKPNNSPDDPDIIRTARDGILQTFSDLAASRSQQETDRPAASIARSSYMLMSRLFSQMGSAERIDRLLNNVLSLTDTDQDSEVSARFARILPEVALGVAGVMDQGNWSGNGASVYPFSIVVSHRGRLPDKMNTDFIAETARILPGTGLLPPFSRLVMLPMLIPSGQAAKLRAGRCWEMAQAMHDACIAGERDYYTMKRIGYRAFGKTLGTGGGKNDFGSSVLFGAWMPPPEGIEPDSFRFSETCSYVDNEQRNVVVHRATNALSPVFSKSLPAGAITSINPTWVEGITSGIISGILHQGANLAIRRGIHPSMGYEDVCCLPTRGGCQIALKRPEGIIAPIHVSPQEWEVAETHILQWASQVIRRPTVTLSTSEQYASFVA